MKELPRDKDKILGIFSRYKFHDEYEHPLENCAEFQALVDAYCSKKQRKGEYLVSRHGTPETPPKEAHKCPDCGQYATRYDLREYDLPPEMQTVGNYSRLCGDSPNLPNVPTFYCVKCGCEWQWVPELPEEPEPGTPATPESCVVLMPVEPVEMSFFDKIRKYFAI